MEKGNKYDKLIIYYFSGTGNAKNAAYWIKEVAEEREIDSYLINIDRFKAIEIPEITEKTLIGFCSATHGFNMPPIVLRFLFKFPSLKNNDVFILNTRGGLKLSKIFLPGLSGLAQYFSAIILLLKGFRVVGMQPLDLPSNWIILHPGLKKKVIDSMFARCKRIVRKFANQLFDGKKKYKAFLSLTFDIAVTPIALGYYFIGRFFLAKTLVSTDACNKCDICIDQCPVEAIKYLNGRLFWAYTCESCMRCVQTCPQKAIQTAHTFSGLAIFLGFGLMSPLLSKLVIHYKLINLNSGSVLTDNIWMTLMWFIFLILLFVLYRILHFFMKYKTINRTIAYTSLTRYKFWRRYRAPKMYSYKKQINEGGSVL